MAKIQQQTDRTREAVIGYWAEGFRRALAHKGVEPPCVVRYVDDGDGRTYEVRIDIVSEPTKAQIEPEPGLF